MNRGRYSENAEFLRYMGLLGFDSDDQQPTRLSQLCLDSVKLPVVDKPQWIGEIEIGLLGATPPVVGLQVP